ncbi:hypothetical protein OIV19_09105 [Brucella sp. HL-2]|nr:hypothetical protein [Brucella sp. HL-2]MCV9907771.1 hypothetical protein [Brucella sp. HL-2]
MADSNDSTTLPEVTRRNLLLTAIASLAAIPTAHFGVADVLGDEQTQCNGVDPAISAWQKWNAVHAQRRHICFQQQQLETKLLSIVGGFPLVEITVPESGRRVVVHTVEEIDSFLSGVAMSEERRRAQALLRARQRKWKKGGEEIGYKRMLNAEMKLMTVESQLADMLLTTPAQSLAGVTAKLHCILEMEGAELEDGGKPGLLLQDILADLIRIDSGESVIFD